MSKQQSTWTPFFNIHDLFEIYPNIDPVTREVIRADGTLGPKMPDGGCRLRFLGPVPRWYAQRDKIYRDEFGALSSTQPNPIEALIQDKDAIFGGLYMYADAFYEPQRGAGYLGIGTSGKMSDKNGTDPFGCGSLSRIWKHTLKILGRHESCNIQLTGGWKRHHRMRQDSLGDPMARDSRFAFFIDHVHTQSELAEYEQAYQEHRLGKYGHKFPINELPASKLSEFERHPI
jgi:hypothetical protein